MNLDEKIEAVKKVRREAEAQEVNRQIAFEMLGWKLFGETVFDPETELLGSKRLFERGTIY